MSAFASFARRLEHGSLPPRLAAPLAHLYGALARPFVRRPVELPDHVRVIGVGGANFGGSGKTAVAIAYAAALAQQGVHVALVSHGYRASTRAVRVDAKACVRDVGDDALVAARALASDGVPVWVARDRSEALESAAREADVVVVDGLLQTRPESLHRAVLTVDAHGCAASRYCPPRGDYRAPLDALVQACDEIVMVRDPLLPVDSALLAQLSSKPTRQGWVEPAWVETSTAETVRVQELNGYRFGLLLTIARPHRVQRALQARSIEPRAHWFGRDHWTPTGAERDRVRELAREHRLQAWLVTPKCSASLEGFDWGAPLWILHPRTRLDPTPIPVVESAPCVPPPGCLLSPPPSPSQFPS